MKSKLFQKIGAWIQERRDDWRDRRHRRALIQEDRREKREFQKVLDRLTK